MADSQSGQNGNEQRSISNIMGATVIVVILLVGGVIAYQNFQLQMAISMLNLIAQDISAKGNK